MNTIPIISAVVLTIGLAVGQCAFSVATVSQVGPGCNPVVGAVEAPLAITVALPACGVAVRPIILLDQGKDPIGRVLVLGLQASAQPVPALGANCVLYPSPDVVLFDPWFGPAYQLQIPSTPLPPTTVYAQGAVLYQFLATAALEWAVTTGFRIDLH
jgi:hypothetical protein